MVQIHSVFALSPKKLVTNWTIRDSLRSLRTMVQAYESQPGRHWQDTQHLRLETIRHTDPWTSWDLYSLPLITFSIGCRCLLLFWRIPSSFSCQDLRSQIYTKCIYPVHAITACNGCRMVVDYSLGRLEARRHHFQSHLNANIINTTHMMMTCFTFLQHMGNWR